MSDQITELLTLPIKPDLNVETPGSKGHKLVADINETVLNIKGCQKLVWGPQHENPDSYEWAMDFESNKARVDFDTSPGFAPFLEKLLAIANGPPTLKLVHFATPFSTASDAPIVEMATFYVGPDSDSGEIEALADKFFDFVRGNARGIVGISSGWTLEDIDTPNGDGKMKALVGAMGWESLEAHKAFAGSNALKEAIGPLAAAVKQIEMHHVKFLY